MKTEGLAWTEYGPLDDEVSIFDPFGFDYYAQILGNVILPGFTTRTDRARYYGMVCYGLYISRKCLEEQHKRDGEKEVLEMFQLYEKYWAYAVAEYYADCNNPLDERDEGENKERGLRGKRGVIAAYNKCTRNLNFKLLSRQLELGALGSYRSSLEYMGLLKPKELKITLKGRALAEAFSHDNVYDKLVIYALKHKNIALKQGRNSLTSFGKYTCLDAIKNSKLKGNDAELYKIENNLLRKELLENKDNKIAITFIRKNMYYGRNIKRPPEIIHAISLMTAKTDKGKKVVNSYRTIQAFENLAVCLNCIWCLIIEEAWDNLGRISVQEAIKGTFKKLEELQRNNYITTLLSQTDYTQIRQALRGDKFDAFLHNYQHLGKHDYGNFIVDLVRYHKDVMDSRNNSQWVLVDRDELELLAGYDYAKKTENMSYLHSYKQNNITSLIKDTRWNTSGQEY